MYGSLTTKELKKKHSKKEEEEEEEEEEKEELLLPRPVHQNKKNMYGPNERTDQSSKNRTKQ